jgi:hypothetical protein
MRPHDTGLAALAECVSDSLTLSLTRKCLLCGSRVPLDRAFCKPTYGVDKPRDCGAEFAIRMLRREFDRHAEEGHR